MVKAKLNELLFVLFTLILTQKRTLQSKFINEWIRTSFVNIKSADREVLVLKCPYFSVLIVFSFAYITK